MILVTGGSGFIGLHTARALLESGESCVLTRYRVGRLPSFLADEVGTRIFIEQVDVSETGALAEVARAHHVDKIVHLATPGLGKMSPTEEVRQNFLGLANVFDAAELSGARRIVVASSISVYNQLLGAGRALSEEDALPMTALVPIEAFKKSFEIVSDFVGRRSGVEVVNARISYVFGPLYHSMANVPSRIVHAAVHSQAATMTDDRPAAPDVDPSEASDPGPVPHTGGAPRPIYAEDGGDYVYVDDVGRAVALLTTATSLEHGVYNVGSGVPVRHREIADAVVRAVPGAKPQLLEGHSPGSPGGVDWLDLGRLGDLGFTPRYVTDTAIADYVAWLKAGHEQ